MAEGVHGYIKLSRKQFDGEDLLWDDKSPFDVRSAWVWLLQAAAWKDGEYVSGFGSDQLTRGEFVASLRYLGIRWKWGKNRVARFLAHLEKAGRISGQRAGQHGRVYSIVNYDTYQTPNGKGGTPRGTEKGTIAGHRRDKVEGRIRKDKENTGGYPAEFELLWKSYPRKPGNNKRETYLQYLARLEDGCSYEAMFEGAKAYHAYCLANGWLGTKWVKGGEVFFGKSRHFASDWTVDPASPPKSENTAERVWQGMKRTKVLFSVNAEQWQSRMEDMVKSGEAESMEWLRQLLKSVNRPQLQNAQNDHFAIEHIAQSLPPNLRIA